MDALLRLEVDTPLLMAVAEELASRAELFRLEEEALLSPPLEKSVLFLRGREGFVEPMGRLTTPFTAEALGGGWMEESVILGRVVACSELDLPRATADVDVKSPGRGAPGLVPGG